MSAKNYSKEKRLVNLSMANESFNEIENTVRFTDNLLKEMSETIEMTDDDSELDLRLKHINNQIVILTSALQTELVKKALRIQEMELAREAIETLNKIAEKAKDKENEKCQPDPVSE